VRIGAGEAIGDSTGAIAAAVVNHDHFVIVSDARQLSQVRANDPLDVALLVMRRQKNAEPGQASWGAHALLFDFKADFGKGFLKN
jgi:hypothetical protein